MTKRELSENIGSENCCISKRSFSCLKLVVEWWRGIRSGTFSALG